MALNSATIAGLTFTTNEINSALALRTNVENLRKVAIQSNLDAAKATAILDSCLETGNKTAVDSILTTLG